jgi:ubiquinone/menaquinone biosynthesis C-methylase UbiE
MQTHPKPDPANFPSCCSGFYEQDWVRYLAEDIFHPGGEALSRKTVEAMKLTPGARIVELGCGTGTTAQLLAKAYGLQVSAIDRSAANVERAETRFGTIQPAAQFTCADAQSLPFEDDVFDAALAECTFSLFPDQSAALAEIHRTLKPGGPFAVTDMATGRPLPEDVASVLAPWTCLADAVDQDSYANLFQANGFEVLEVCDESWGIQDLMLQIKRKLLLLSTGRLVAPGALPELDTASIRHWLERIRQLVEDGTIRYLRFQLARRD